MQWAGRDRQHTESEITWLEGTVTTTLPATEDVTDSEPAPVEPRGGTRWRRVGVLFVPAVVVMLLLGYLTIEGHLPLRLTVTGQDFKLSSNGAPVRTASGLTIYPATITMKDGSTRGIVIAGIDQAELPKGLCISLTLTFPVVGTFTVRLHTSGDTKANGMVLDSSGLHAESATLSPVTSGRDGTGKVLVPSTIGKDSGTLGGSHPGPSGRFGIEAPGPGELTGLRASAEGAIISGTVTLKGLGVGISRGRGVSNGECF